MDGDRERLEASWKRTREHLAAARAELSALPSADLSDTDEMLSYNELGLAFDCLVDLGNSSDLGRSFWEHLDLAAREMGLYSRVLHTPNLTSVDFLLRHLAATAGGAAAR